MTSIFPDSGVPASQALNSVDTATTGCVELFYSTARCKPRFDPAAANAMMSELLNTVSQSALVWDCARRDNLSLAITQRIINILTGCLPATLVFETDNTDVEDLFLLAIDATDPDGCRQIRQVTNLRTQWSRLFNEFITECITGTIPALGTQCGTVRQLVLTDDGDGCIKLASYSPTDAATGGGDFRTAQPHLPPDTQGFFIPDDFAVPTNYYNLATFQADDANGLGTLNEARILNSRVAAGAFTAACQRTYSLNALMLIQKEPLVADAYAAAARIFWRYRVNGGAWVYPRTGGGQITAVATFNGLALTQAPEGIVTIPAGNIEFQLFYVAEQAGNPTPPVRINASTFPRVGGLSNGHPNFTLRPNV